MSGPAATPAASRSADDLRLARLHVRLGLLTLARAEVEELANRGPVDVDDLATLAEARWRTGDGERAVEAARAHIDGGGTDEIAICIAAEAAAAAGDMDAARALMDRLGPPEATVVDALFAGMPQRASWPVAPDATARPERGGVRPGAPEGGSPGPRRGHDAASEAGRLSAPAALAGAAGAPTGAPVRDRRTQVAWDPAAELRRAREELGSRPERAFVRMALVLRLDPTLAPAVLDAVALRREPAAALLRGDAQRLLGRHLEARAAFEAAAESLEAT